jgi:hypothetical protein
MQGDPMKLLLTITALASAVIGPAVAQDETERGNKNAVLELTMTLLPANAETPSVVTAAIELPKDASGAYIPSADGVEHSAPGLSTANLAREDGRAFGQATAAAARENRENATRASRDAEVEGPPPAPPEPPDHPSPPPR